MPSTSANAAVSASRLADCYPLDAAAAVRVFEQLLNQVAALHKSGRLHGKIVADSITVGVDGIAEIASPTSEITFRGDIDAAQLFPPELPANLAIPLPTEINAARKHLANVGIDCDPVRIDLYQLGALLCEMLTGQTVAAFLQSAKVRSRVPVEFRDVIDRSLGYAAAARYQRISELQAGFSAATRSPRVSTTSETPAIHSGVMPAPETPPPAVGSIARAATLAEDSRLGSYRIVKRIGGGGMGDVYQAYEESLDRHVAIKVLPPELARHEDFVRRFRAEAAAVAKLVHPNVVQIHSIGEESGHHYFAMQFVSGESLADMLKRRGRLPLEETLAIVEQCLAGLKAAHDRGLIHRDVKPGNILLDHESHRPLLADFGLVKGIGNGSSLTATGIIMGTVDYIPPEQARGQPIDGRADLYSLGVLMYQMLSGRLPFEANSSTAMIFKHAYEQPPLLSELVPEVPRRIAAIITRLMSKNPDHRYQNADEVMADLISFRTGKPPAIPRRAVAASSSIMERSNALLHSGGSEAIGVPAGSYEPAGWQDGAGTDRRWTDWRDRLWSIFRRGTPQLADKFANTTQQVDGAISEYERRHSDLAQLVRDAEEVSSELAAQIASHQEAARVAAKKAAYAQPDIAAGLQKDQRQYEQIAAEFAAQLKEHRAQTDGLQTRLTNVAATLKQLRSQRDLLQTRLRTAEARIEMEAGPITRYRRRMPTWIAAATVVGLLFVLWLGRSLLHGDHQPVVATPAPLTTTATLPANLTGRFIILCRGRFELFINNQQLTFDGPESEPVSLHEGDIVFLRAISAYYADYRGLKLDFVSNDGVLAWPARRQDFKIIEAGGPATISAEVLSRSTEIPAEGRAGVAILGDWAKLELLGGDRSELMWWGGQNRWWQAAAMVRATNFIQATNAPHPPPILSASNWPAAAPAPSAEDGPVGSGLAGGVPGQFSGRFYIGCKGEFEVYVNGVRLSFPVQPASSIFQSQPISLQKGDVVLVRANSRFVFRAISMEFVSDDGLWCWPVNHSQFSVLGDAPVPSINADLIRKSPVTTLPAQISPEVAGAWNHLDLPHSDDSEWFWPKGENDKNRWLQFATIIRPAMFIETRTTGRSTTNVGGASSGNVSRTPPPSDAVEFNAHHYKLVLNRGITWDDAEAACENLGGHLACPTTPEQLQLIDKLKEGKAVWLGGYFDAAAQNPAWKWLTGQKINRQSPSNNSTDLWIATTVGDKTGVIGRAQDGTLRKPDGSIMHALNTNIQGYICEWDN